MLIVGEIMINIKTKEYKDNVAIGFYKDTEKFAYRTLFLTKEEYLAWKKK